MEKRKHISIRVPEATMKKFSHISKYDDRSISGQIMYLINKSIRDFEEKHGKIELPEEHSNDSKDF